MEVKNIVRITKKPLRITQVHGSLEGKQILRLREEQEELVQNKQEERLQKDNLKRQGNENFIRCKLDCVCKTAVSILKSKCTTAKYKIAS